MIEVWNKNPKKNKDSGMWEVKIFTPEGEFIRMVEYKEQSEAFAAIKDGNSKADKSPIQKEKKRIQNEEKFLEKFIVANKSDNPDDDQNEFENSAGLIKKALEEYQTQFKGEVSAAETEARILLEQVAKAYLGADVIERDEYMKYKTQLQTKDLGELVWQLAVSKKAIFRLSQEIQIGTPTKATYDALAVLQKVSLEFVKFRQEYLDKLEKSLKDYKVDMTMGIVGDGSSEMQESALERTGSVIHTSDRRKLIKELDTILIESRESVKTARSKNERLHDDDPDVHEDGFELVEEDFSSDEELEDLPSLGLETFRDEDFDEEDK